MSDSSQFPEQRIMYADTEMHLWKIANELECIRDLLGKFLNQQPCPPETGVTQVAISEPAEFETDSQLFYSMLKKVRRPRQKGLKKKRYSADVKASVVHSILQCGKTPTQVSEFYGVHLNTLAHWISDAKKGIT